MPKINALDRRIINSFCEKYIKADLIQLIENIFKNKANQKMMNKVSALEEE